MTDNATSTSTGQPTAGRRAGGRWMVWAVLLLAAGAYVYVNRPVPASFSWQTDYEAGLAQARTAGRPVLLEFQTAGCPACEWMDREVFASRKVAEALADWVPIRIDGNAQPKFSIQYGVEAFPTFVLLDPDGKVLRSTVGSIPEAEFISFLQSARATPPTSSASAG